MYGSSSPHSIINHQASIGSVWSVSLLYSTSQFTVCSFNNVSALNGFVSDGSVYQPTNSYPFLIHVGTDTVPP